MSGIVTVGEFEDMSTSPITNRLYYDDPYLVEFRAIVISVRERAPDDGTLHVLLDRTAFYPTSGGQPNDVGTIEGLRVVDGYEEDGSVVHVVERDSAAGLAAGRTVDCAIDWERRFDHMQQHLGQHILSSAFEKVLDADTVGFHLGAEHVTIDLNVPPPDEHAVWKAEDLANDIVFEDRPVRTPWCTPEEARELPLRKPPDREGPLRIVTVEGFDYSPCGGTHPRRTGEVGFIKILRWEKVRSGTRVYFVCGRRALLDYRWRTSLTNSLAQTLSTGPRDLPQAVDRLRKGLEDLARERDTLAARLIELEADSLISRALRGGMPGSDGGEAYVVVAEEFRERPIHEVKALAHALTSREMVVAFLASETEGPLGVETRVVFACSEGIPLNMKDLLVEALSPAGGKGGGTRRLAQGGVTGVRAGAVLEAAVALINPPLPDRR